MIKLECISGMVEQVGLMLAFFVNKKSTTRGTFALGHRMSQCFWSLYWKTRLLGLGGELVHKPTSPP